MTYADVDGDDVEVVGFGSSISYEDDSGVDGKESNMVSSGVGSCVIVRRGNRSCWSCESRWRGIYTRLDGTKRSLFDRHTQAGATPQRV